ncbi:hypothetical protein LTR56_025131 [Elasticomyces elasticus]|nr:hypothetical protein LTR56_025131 [Elasticomyces elasticus]KAK3621311.1 hypothetical protein LTR22_025246 [Elasticomyces elasticus]KAK4904862.1 hypothetical protein LTR49_025753 [Elasticomyces elasticus]KAK5741016.1 hypothetical protein LTS12_024736 [Elasticomyces elasticus]
MASSSGSAVAPASESDATAPPTQQTSKLLTIAAELRNSIYELVFSKPPGPTELLTATRPPDDLRLVCKQTNHEARGLWLAANRDYWPNTTFTITKQIRPKNDKFLPLRMAFTKKDLASIRTMQFTATISRLDKLVQLFEEEDISYEHGEQITFEHRAGRKGQWLLWGFDGEKFNQELLTILMHVTVLRPYFRQMRVEKLRSASTEVPKTREVTPDDLFVLLGRGVVLADAKDGIWRKGNA